MDMINNVTLLTWKPLHKEDNGSFSALTSDGKSKYFIMKKQDGSGYRVYGIEGINDGGTEFNESVDKVKEIVYRHWVDKVMNYLGGEPIKEL